MNGKPTVWMLLSFAAALGLLAGSTSAAPPWGGLLTFNRMEADPNKDYRLAKDNGPWMIMACSFAGEGAEEQARELALELRKRYKLPAYVHRMRFDFSDPQGRGIDKNGARLALKYRKGNEREEIAVLVGNYTAVDDPEAQRTLEQIKYCQPACLALDPTKPTKRNLAAWRLFAKYASEEKEKRGPMNKAFVTTNPMLPKEFFSGPGIDPLVLQMNRNVTHSLLDCPGRYTVQVARFKGEVIIDHKEIEAVERGGRMHSSLMQAADRAHKLTEALRMKGWEAYEFHDRYASYVTVGSFDSMGSPRADGKTELAPAVHTILRTFGAEPVSAPGLPAGATTMKSLVGIPFDVQPMVVEVPKRSISRELAGQ